MRMNTGEGNEANGKAGGTEEKSVIIWHRHDKKKAKRDRLG